MTDCLAPISPKLVRKLMRDAKRSNPSFMRAIRKLSDAQLRSLEAELLEDEIRKLRHTPRFRKSAELQFLVAKYDYDLRLLSEIEYWKNNPHRRQIKRWRDPAETPQPQTLPAPATLPTTLAAVINPFSEPVPESEPDKPDNVIRLDTFHSKFFHNYRAEDNGVW